LNSIQKEEVIIYMMIGDADIQGQETNNRVGNAGLGKL